MLLGSDQSVSTGGGAEFFLGKTSSLEDGPRPREKQRRKKREERERKVDVCMCTCQE